MERSECASGVEDPHIGRTLRERYRLDERIGSGAMGAVYRAWDLQRMQLCAVKLLRLRAAERESIVVRFCDEARIVAQLCHPNIVELYDQGEEEDGTLFLTMELLRGHDLYSLLRSQMRLPLSRALEIVRQVGSALQTVHLTGMVHRDIKPRNIFLTQTPDSGEPGLVKVIDFGLAKILDGQGSSRGSDGLLIGTPEYLAPEAWRGISSDIDARSDQWSLAVLCYRMLSGRLPFDGCNDTVMLAREILSAAPHPLRRFVPDLPPHVEAAITQALAKDKELRFGSVLDFVRALYGLPLAGTVYLRREPQTALLYRSERPTVALSMNNDATAALVAAPLTAAIELTAMLPPVPIVTIVAAKARPPSRPQRRLSHWWRLVPVLGLLAIGGAGGAAGGTFWPRPVMPFKLASPELLVPRDRGRGQPAHFRIPLEPPLPLPGEHRLAQSHVRGAAASLPSVHPTALPRNPLEKLRSRGPASDRKRSADHPGAHDHRSANVLLPWPGEKLVQNKLLP